MLIKTTLGPDLTIHDDLDRDDDICLEWDCGHCGHIENTYLTVDQARDVIAHLQALIGDSTDE